MRKPLTAKQRKQILDRDGNKCVKCWMRGEGLEVHHIAAVVYDGTNDPENLATLCHVCHMWAPDGKEAFAHYIERRMPQPFEQGLKMAESSVEILFEKYGMNAKKEEATRLLNEMWQEMWDATATENMPTIMACSRKWFEIMKPAQPSE